MRLRLGLLLAAALLMEAAPAFAADLSMPHAPPAPESDAYNWTGVYVGVNAGYSWTQGVGMFTNSLLTSFNPVNSNPAGGFGGITLGVNQQLANGFVLGAEGDVDYGDVTSSIPDTVVPGDTITSTSNWSGTARGRLGYATGSLMPYLTAGLAVADSSVTANGGGASATLYGWTAGGGLEMALGNKLSAKLEYLYTDFGTHTWFAGQVNESTSTSTSSTVRVGLNYGF